MRKKRQVYEFYGVENDVAKWNLVLRRNNLQFERSVDLPKGQSSLEALRKHTQNASAFYNMLEAEAILCSWESDIENGEPGFLLTFFYRSILGFYKMEFVDRISPNVYRRIPLLPKPIKNTFFAPRNAAQ